MVPYGASAAVQSKFEEVQWPQPVTSNSDFKGKMSESELVFSRCKLEEVQWLRTVTSNSDFEGKMSESELVFSRCCRAKCNKTLCFRSVVEQSAAKHDVLDVLSSKVQQNIMFLEVLSSKVQQNTHFSRCCRAKCSKTLCFSTCCPAKCSKTSCPWQPSDSGAVYSSIQCLRRWICRQVQCFRRPRNDSRELFSWICRHLQCFQMILVISVILVVLGRLGWSWVVSGSRFLGFVDRCNVFERFRCCEAGTSQSLSVKAERGRWRRNEEKPQKLKSFKLLAEPII